MKLFLKEESKLWLAKSEWREDHLIFTTVQTILNQKQCEIQKNALSKEDVKVVLFKESCEC